MVEQSAYAVERLEEEPEFDPADDEFKSAVDGPLNLRASLGERGPLWHASELAVLIVLFEVGLWYIGPRITRGGGIVAAYWAMVIAGAILVLWFSPRLHGDAPVQRGWGFFGAPRNDLGAIARALPFYAAATLAGIGAVVALAAWRDPHFVQHISVHDLILKFAGYLVWAPVQALIFFGYVPMRLRGLSTALPAVARPWSVIIPAAAIFSMAHAPNPWMLGLTFPAGIVWSWLYYHRANLLLLSLSHATVGACVSQVLKISTRVGPFYQQPELHILQNVIPGLRQVFGNLF